MHMTENRRQMMLRICDNHPQIPIYLFHLNSYVKCDEMLQWLIQNRLTGAEFMKWTLFYHGKSMLGVGETILKWIEKEKGTRPILAGSDFILR